MYFFHVLFWTHIIMFLLFKMCQNRHMLPWSGLNFDYTQHSRVDKHKTYFPQNHVLLALIIYTSNTTAEWFRGFVLIIVITKRPHLDFLFTILEVVPARLSLQVPRT